MTDGHEHTERVQMHGCSAKQAHRHQPVVYAPLRTSTRTRTQAQSENVS